MILQTLLESHAKGQLLLVENGFCRFHIRKDGMLVIYEIFSTKRGTGKSILRILENKVHNGILARCPSHYESNGWYNACGFVVVSVVAMDTYTLYEWYKKKA
jgi:hypothetical protein